VTETEFLDRWHAERSIYKAWGEFVKSRVEVGLREQDASLDLEYFIKVPALPRLKADDSLLGKAFHRGKTYSDPYAQIEDKVGIRFVVLLSSDIKRISDVIENESAWSSSLDRDFEAEREKRPLEFAYQSKHYVVQARAPVEFEGVTITQGTPCEVQLRTLLQHAHSELTHGPIYKPSSDITVSGKIQRTVAKSMALIEAADDFFELVVKDLQQASEVERYALSVLRATYERRVGLVSHVDKTSSLILNAYKDSLGEDLAESLDALLTRYPFVASRISERFARNYAYRQPWILLAYLLASQKPAELKERWPIGLSELEPVFTDLGRQLNSSR
jgi:putative GTP pyrophosphokinase